MKNVRIFFPCLALLLSLAARPAAAQAQNAQAMNWFNLGMNEKTADKKIAAYQKAVELDPQFVEALYNLGLAYKQQQDYRSAAQYLLRAYQARPDKTKGDTQFQILYELAASYKKLGRTEDYMEAIRAAKDLRADAAMKSRLQLELGRFLYEQGRLEEAESELQAGRQMSVANSGEFADMIQKIELAREAQALYEAAHKAAAGGELRQARALLEQIQAKQPGYKDTAAKLTELNEKLEGESKKQSFALLYEQAQKYAAAGNLEMAVATYESLVQQAGVYKDARSKFQAARQQLEQKQLEAKLEAEYANGMSALRSNDWTRAILAFEKTLEWDRNYRDARKRLTEAQNGLNRESTETIVTRYYAEGVRARSRDDLGGALAAFEKVRRLNPNYRNVAALITELENTLAQQSQPAPPAAAPASTDSLYQQALAFIEKQDWMQAAVTLEKVQLLQPNYRDVVDRLALARTNLNRATPAAQVAQAPENDEPSTTAYLGSALAALILLPLVGLMVFSPIARARLHLMRGDYVAAAASYERILERHPNRAKFYPILADLYMLMGRHDEKALKIFKVILQLNLATKHRDAINAVVAENFLTEGRTDSDAIEVLESALQAERRKQSSRI